MVPKNWARWSGVAAVLLCVLFLTLLTTEKSLPKDAQATPPVLPPDLAKVPSNAIFVASGRIADLWNGELHKTFRQKLANEMDEGARAFENKFGLPLDQVERITLAFLNVMGPAEPLLFVGTTKPYDRDKVIAGPDKPKEEKYKGQTIYSKGNDLAVYLLGERALVYGSPNDIRGLIDNPVKSGGHLAEALRLAAGKHTAVIAVNVKAINDEIGERLPGEVEPFKPLLKALYGTLTLDVGAELRAEVKLTFSNDKEAKAAADPARTGLDLARSVIERGVEELSREKGLSKFVELLKQLQESVKKVQIEQTGKTLQASARHKVDVANLGVVLVEAVQKTRGAAARAQSQNNLKQIALAMHNYHDAYKRFPAQATYDKSGKPLLSWRVAILPFIEQQNLYNQFHLDEPWDSEHNKKLLAVMPRTYASPEDDEASKKHATHYQGFVGKGAFFEGKQGITIADITDGTSNTIMVVEGSKAVPWTKPEDVPFDPAKPLPKLGLPGASGFQAAMGDGSVRMIPHKITKETLQNAIMRNDGNPLGPDF